MTHGLAMLSLAVLALAPTLAAQAPDRDWSRASDEARRGHALALMREVPLIDGHNDVPWQYRKIAQNHLERLDLASDTSGLESPMHTDLARLRAGGVGGQFWSVYIPIRRFGGDPGDARTVIEQIDLVKRMVARYPDDLELALDADDVVRIHGEGRIASMMGMEGGHSIENSLAVLRATYDLGARYMTITHSISTTWADSATDETRVDGLTAFGEAVLREMNRIGMIVDLSHVSPATMHAAIDLVEAPIIFSHSSAFALCAHPRNVPDDVLTRLPANGGVVMVTFVPSFVCEDLRTWTEARRGERQRLAELHVDDLDQIESGVSAWKDANPAPRCTLSDVADHVDHVRRVAGADHVGIGSDFDGVSAVPEGLDDVSRYPDLVAELLRRGWGDEDLRKLLGLNVLRVMRQVERVSARARRERPADDSLIEELDGPTGSR